MSSLRDRLNAMRPGAAARSAPVALSGATATAVAAPRAELRTTRVLLPEWDLDADERALLMRTLGGLCRDESVASLMPEDLLFLDLETTGLSLGAGTLAFLVGTARLVPTARGMELLVEQRLMRALAHEREILIEAALGLAECGAIVTFNGKSYDLPLLLGRCVLARVQAPPPRPHVDALHPARRLLSHALPDVRLMTLETELWGMRRADDLGGAAIPAAFFAALRGDDGMLDDVLRHNADDLVTLARLPPLLGRLARGGAAPSGVIADPLVLAELRLRDGERAEALSVIEACRTLPGSPRSVRRARLAKRAGGPQAAREHWRRLCREARAGCEPHEELAKILEHHDRDCGAALQVVESALERFAGDPEARERLLHRRGRLLRKLEKLARFSQRARFPEDGLSG